jgi:RNA polymerase sigma-70 factor (ECF subfamily)
LTRPSRPSFLLRAETPAAPFESRAGFSGLYERLHLPVFRYLYGLTGGVQAEAEDLAAETFLRAWRARRSFVGDEPAALGWLLKIARRLAIDAYRRRQARPQAQPDADLAAVPASDLPLDEAAQAGEQQAILTSLLRSLPPERREMLALRYLLGWRVKQIAAYLEIPENTVSAGIRRALERLRTRWPQEESR